MALQARLLSKFLPLLIAVPALMLCSKKSNMHVSFSKVPPVYINSSIQNLYTRGGITYLEGKAFSGFIVELYGTCDTASLTPFLNGREHGIARGWYPGKKIEYVRIYEMGMKTGIHRGWWPNGKQKFEYHLTNDMYHGSVKEWFSDGHLAKNFNYSYGQEQGMQTLYFPDGSIQANYETKNGRNYGNTGYSNCESPAKKAVAGI